MKYLFEQLLNRSFAAIKGRGLITKETNEIHFLKKMKEELSEFENAVLFGSQNEKVEESTDLATVCFMYLMHIGKNPVKEFEKIVVKNERRVNKVK